MKELLKKLGKRDTPRRRRSTFGGETQSDDEQDASVERGRARGANFSSRRGASELQEDSECSFLFVDPADR